MTHLDRRRFLGSAGAAAFAAASSLEAAEAEWRRGWRIRGTADDWDELRNQFDLDRDYIHLAGLLIASHPKPVAEAVERHRRALDENPAVYLRDDRTLLEGAVRRAAARYLAAGYDDIALTDSTTMGIALVYNGVQVRQGQELLTTTNDYYVTHDSLRYKAERSGASVRIIEPFASSADATADEITDRIVSAVTPATRVLGLTWVHSWTGVKIPVRRIADGLAELNASRAPEDRVLLGLDAVHGLGVEDQDVPSLGCDFFMAGTHKWLFGPRGTGILWGRPETQAAVTPTIPTFSYDTAWGDRMTPGGYKAFEHRWAVAQAFDLHRQIGRGRITERIRELNRQCKEGLREMRHVRLYTPMDPSLSAGIVSFDVEGMSAEEVVGRLAQKRILASVTPYTPEHARLAPGLLNDPEEIDATLEAIRALG